MSDTSRAVSPGLAVWFVQLDPPGRIPGVCWRAELYGPGALGTMAFPLATAYLSDYRPALGVVVDYVLVPDHLRRRGHASRLIAECRRKWPELVLTDAISPEGEALIASVEADEVPS